MKSKIVNKSSGMASKRVAFFRQEWSKVSPDWTWIWNDMLSDLIKVWWKKYPRFQSQLQTMCISKDSHLNKVLKSRKLDALVFGEFNIDTLQHHHDWKDYIHFSTADYLAVHKFEPTRRKVKSNSWIIDHTLSTVQLQTKLVP